MQHEDSQQGMGTHRAIVQKGLLPLSDRRGREDEDVRQHGAAARSMQQALLSRPALEPMLDPCSQGQPSSSTELQADPSQEWACSCAWLTQQYRHCSGRLRV